MSLRNKNYTTISLSPGLQVYIREKKGFDRSYDAFLREVFSEWAQFHDVELPPEEVVPEIKSLIPVQLDTMTEEIRKQNFDVKIAEFREKFKVEPEIEPEIEPETPTITSPWRDGGTLCPDLECEGRIFEIMVGTDLRHEHCARCGGEWDWVDEDHPAFPIEFVEVSDSVEIEPIVHQDIVEVSTPEFGLSEAEIESEFENHNPYAESEPGAGVDRADLVKTGDLLRDRGESVGVVTGSELDVPDFSYAETELIEPESEIIIPPVPEPEIEIELPKPKPIITKYQCPLCDEGTISVDLENFTEAVCPECHEFYEKADVLTYLDRVEKK